MAGRGRYSNYTPLNVQSAAAYARRYALFNAKAADDKGAFFGSDGGNVSKYIETSGKLFEAGVGDLQMFPKGVDFKFGEAPNLQDTSLGRSGDPANPFMPDVSSPGAVDGAVNIDPKAKTGNGSIDVADVKPNYIVANGVVGEDAQNLGTQSPSTTSTLVGQSTLLKNLVPGKSNGTLGGG